MTPHKAARIRVEKDREGADVWRVILPARPERGLPERYAVFLGHDYAIHVADRIARRPETERYVLWRAVVYRHRVTPATAGAVK